MPKGQPRPKAPNNFLTTLPRDIPQYGTYLKLNIPVDWKLTTTNIPVDGSGIIRLDIIYRYDIILPKPPRKVYRKFKGSEDKYLEKEMLLGIQAKVDEVFDDTATTLRVGEKIAEWLLLGMQGRLNSDGLGNSDLYKSLKTHVASVIRSKPENNVNRLEIQFALEMLYYGPYIDAKTYGATRKGPVVDEWGTTEFLAALEMWVRKHMTGTDAHLSAIARSIWHRISETGERKTKPNDFITGTLTDAVTTGVIDRIMDAEYQKKIEEAVEKGIRAGIEGINEPDVEVHIR